MSRRLEGRQQALVRRIPLGCDCDERAILTVFIRAAERFVDHWQRALAMLARALGDQLLDPESQRRQ